jgi:hypothetical protein
MDEIKVVDEQGVTHIFPPGSSPEMIAAAMGVKPPSGVESRNAVSAAGAADDPSFRWHRQEANPEIDTEVQRAIASTRPKFLFDQPRPVDVLPGLFGFENEGGMAPVGPTRELAPLRAGDVASGLINTVTDPAIGAESGAPQVGSEAVQGARNLATPGKRVRGAAQLVGAVGEGLSPVVGPAILESPISVGAGLAAGMGTSEGAGRATKALGGGEDAQELARQAGFWIPSLAGSALPWLRGKGRPTESVTEIPSSPEGTSAVTSAPEVQSATHQAAPLESQQAPVEATLVEPNPEVMQAEKRAPVAQESRQPSASEGVSAETKPIYQMSPDELDAAAKADKAKDQQMLVDLFGEDGAKQYNRLQRKANSTSASFAETNAASDELGKMESSLTPEQQDQLYGAGAGHTYEDFADFRRKIGSVGGDTPAELGSSMKWSISRMGDIQDPAKMNRDQQMAYAQLRHGFEIADRNGWDKNEVLQSALKGASARFEPNDAAYMLRQFMKGEPTAAVANESRPALPWLRKGSPRESGERVAPSLEATSPSEGVHVEPRVLERAPSTEQMKIA